MVNTARKYRYIDICSLSTNHTVCIQRDIHIIPTKAITIHTYALYCLMPLTVLHVSA